MAGAESGGSAVDSGPCWVIPGPEKYVEVLGCNCTYFWVPGSSKSGMRKRKHFVAALCSDGVWALLAMSVPTVAQAWRDAGLDRF